MHELCPMNKTRLALEGTAVIFEQALRSNYSKLRVFLMRSSTLISALDEASFSTVF